MEGWDLIRDHIPKDVFVESKVTVGEHIAERRYLSPLDPWVAST